MERISNLEPGTQAGKIELDLNLDPISEIRFRILHLLHDNRDTPLRLCKIMDGLRNRFGINLGKSSICYHLNVLITNGFMRSEKREVRGIKGFARQKEVRHYSLTSEGGLTYERLRNVYVKI